MMDVDLSPPRVRQSIQELSKDRAKFEVFLKALRDVQNLPPENPNSYWAIAGYHGEPFKPRMVDGDPAQVWGGYCQHANVLFPFWHRAYILRLEQALQTVSPGNDVMFPYWDQTSDENLEVGIPKAVTDLYVSIDGKTVANPLRSFVLPKEIGKDKSDEYYFKPKGYETVRYPYSGINSPPENKKKADKHNYEMNERGDDYVLDALQKNMKYYIKGSTDKRSSIKDMYTDCLKAPDYTSFSNTVSGKYKLRTSLESPHNWIHLAVGGIYFPDQDTEEGLLKGANGDMGENETAGFDPLFFLHHCNVDRVFWLWQKKYGRTKTIEIQKDDPGTNPSSKNGQGPTPFQKDNQKLTTETVLHPFQHADGLPYVPTDLVDIENQLGYTYSMGSLEEKESMPKGMPKKEQTGFETASSVDEYVKIIERLVKETPAHFYEASYHRVIVDISGCKEDFRKLATERGAYKYLTEKPEYFIKVNNVNCNLYTGSFFVRVFYKNKDHPLGDEAVLGRWNAANCKNCQFHRLVDVVVKASKDMPFPFDVQDLLVVVSYFDPASGTSKTEPLEILKIAETKTAATEASPSVSFFIASTPGRLP